MRYTIQEERKSKKITARIGIMLLGILIALLLSTCINPLDEIITRDIAVKFG